MQSERTQQGHLLTTVDPEMVPLHKEEIIPMSIFYLRYNSRIIKFTFLCVCAQFCEF